MRSAGKMRSASPIASSGSLSPTSEVTDASSAAAATARSVAAAAASASAIAASASETQKASAESLRLGARTRTDDACRSVSSRIRVIWSRSSGTEVTSSTRVGASKAVMLRPYPRAARRKRGTRASPRRAAGSEAV